MTANHPPTNPLFASPSPSALTIVSPSRRASPGRRETRRIWRHGGAAWLVTAVATGYGVAAADTTGALRNRHHRVRRARHPPVSHPTDRRPHRPREPRTHLLRRRLADQHQTLPDPDGGPTSSRTPGCPRRHDQQQRRRAYQHHDPGASTAPESTSGEPLEETSGVAAQPEPSERSGGAPDPSVADTPPVTPGSGERPDDRGARRTESNSTSSAVTINAAGSSVSAHGVVATEEQPSATVTSTAVPSLQASKLRRRRSAHS